METPTPVQATVPSPKATAQAKYALAFLFVLYALNYVDRQLLSILMEPIRKDLHLSDTQLGFLSGLAFAIFYATLGIPIARLADRYSRRNIVTLAVIVWSIMTAFSGMAQSFVALLAARIGVGVGEAGASPPAHAMISDYFPPHRRASALAIYSCGIPVGILLGLAGGGWVNEAFGWRTAFFVIGIPGVVLALLYLVTVREPIRGAQDGGIAPQPVPSIATAFRHLWNLKTFRYLTVASALHALTAYGVLQWNPSYIIRSFGLGTREVGLHVGLIIGMAGGVGTLVGGFASDWLGKRDYRWYLWFPAFFIALAIPFYFATFLAGSAAHALLFFIMPAFVGSLFTGPAFAMVQALAPTRMRAMAASIYLFILNIVGLGLGPLTVGIASDLLHPVLGAASLRWSLCGVSVFEFAAVYFFMLAAKTAAAETAATKR